MCNIKHNRDGWPDAVRRHLGSTATDFLLHRIDRIGRGVRPFFIRVQVSQNIGQNEPANPVVQSPSDDEAIGKFHRIIDKNRRRSDADAELIDILLR